MKRIMPARVKEIFTKGIKANDCLNKFLVTLVFSLHAIGNKQKIAFLRCNNE